MRTWPMALLVANLALAQSSPSRSFFSLSSSNGHGAVMVDARAGKAVHFREHLAATEEPQLDAMGHEVWVGNQPQVVKSRDLLFDAYFGVRASGAQQWLTAPPDGSGYAAPSAAWPAGSGVVHWRHDRALGLEATTFVFAPRELPHASFVMALRLRNTGSAAVTGVSAFSLHNLHLGFGRPGVMQEVGANGERINVTSALDMEERGFAGVVVARPLGPVARASAWNGTTPPAENGFRVVEQGGVGDLAARTGDLGVADDWAGAFQFDVGTLAPGQERWVGVAFAHVGDPFGAGTVRGWLDAWQGARDARTLVEAELAAWAAFQQGLAVPAGLTSEEEAVARQSAVVLAMAQVREREAYLREVLSRDGEPRWSRFTDGGTPLPGVVAHRGAGAVLASLPPGEWTYAWIRDGAYAAAAMATLGLVQESRDALRFYLDAEGGRFQGWSELSGYGLPPYVVSLTRYLGFGVEETDFNDFGPNLEFDGFGLFLWALRQHELRTGDTSLADERWEQVATRIAEPLVALVDPTTGLVRRDSSIWETHWNGRQRSWTYTSLTAARGLCDAAALAERRHDGARAMRYRQAGEALRRAIARQLTDATGVLASNREELESGEGYFDAAVFDALALGLFEPGGRIGRATTAALESRLRVAAGPGWSRSDDRRDHAGRADLSPWGSEYDSAEWVITDLRGAMVLRAQGQAARADQILGWITAQASANAGVIPETFDEATGAWKFNAPMVGFGAGAYVLALAQRGLGAPEPACGSAFPEGPPDGGLDPGPVDAGAPGGRDGGGPAATPAADGGAVAVGMDGGADGGGAGPLPPAPPAGCGCGASAVASGWAWLALVGLATRRQRRSGQG